MRGAVGGIPADPLTPGEHRLQVEHGGQVEQHDAAFGHREVVHHDGRGQSDVAAVHQLAVGSRGVQAQVRREGAVPEEDHLAGGGVDLGMGRHRPGESTVEVVFPDGGELSGELHRTGRFHQRQQGARVAHDVGVRGVLHQPDLGDHVGVGLAELAQPTEQGPPGAAFGEQPGRFDPAVAIRGAAVGDRDCVDHAVTVEEVVAAERGELRVGTIAQIGALQALREWCRAR